MYKGRQILKQEMTLKMLEWLKELKEIGLDKEISSSVLWHNNRAYGGLRLTDTGYNLLKTKGVGDYPFNLADLNFSNKLLFLLDKRLQTPYYITMSSGRIKIPLLLSLFGSEEAMMLTLHGDLARFLELQ